MEKKEKKYPIGGYAPGHYHCICINCNATFIGDKRSVQCEQCATKTLKKMELETAIEILEHHQEWRQGKRQDMIHEPKKLTEALDVLIALAKKFEMSDETPNLDNLLELAREEGKKYAYHNIHQELEYIGFVRGITFIIDKLKELGK